ncbi:MAG: hypothetical protein ABSF38_14005 [Verrucomicrobiota bacterium]
MPKWVKMFIGILLLPVCVGTALALWRVLTQAGGADRVWLPMLAGAAGWIVIFLLLPKPMWVYVFGHELTHALWTWIFGGNVKQFKAGSQGGHVVATKSNFLIVLAPYFFPLYAALLVLAFLVCDLFGAWRPAYVPWFHVLLGAAYAFHITLTWHILKTRQTDITSQGYIFSAAVIFLGNALVLLIAVPLLVRHGLVQSLIFWLQCNRDVVKRIVRWL